MSILSLDDAKAFLDVIHSGDDAKLQMLLDAAESEAVEFMNRGLLDSVVKVVSDCGASSLVAIPPLPDSDDSPPASMALGVLLFLQAAYQALPDDAEKLRRAGEIKLQPFRIGLGV